MYSHPPLWPRALAHPLVAHARLPVAQHLCASCEHPVQSFLSYPCFSICFSPLPPFSFQRRQIPSESGLINWSICCSLLSSSCDHLFDFRFLGTNTSLAPAEKRRKGGRDRGRQKGRKFLHQPHSWAALGPTAKFSLPRVSSPMSHVKEGRSGKGRVPVEISGKIYIWRCPRIHKEAY